MVWQAWPSLQPLVGAFNKERVQVGLNIEFREILLTPLVLKCCRTSFCETAVKTPDEIANFSDPSMWNRRTRTCPMYGGW